MKIVAAIVMGFFSGAMIYLIGNFLLLISLGFEGASDRTLLVIVLLAGLAGWAASGYWLHQGAQAVSGVLARGLLLGAAEWLIMLALGLLRPIVMGGVGVLSATVVAGLSLIMSIACLVGFAIIHFWQRQPKNS